MGKRGLLVVALLAAAFAQPSMRPVAAPATSFQDVPAGYFAERAILAVGQERDWMRAFGATSFAPESYETRKRFAVALVRAFARYDSVDPATTITDLPKTDYAYGAVNVAVRRGWMSAPQGVFKPNDAITRAQMSVALVHALGLTEESLALARITTADGYRFKVGYAFGQQILAAELQLHYNHPTSQESREMLPWSPVRRGDAAYSLWATANAVGSWRVSSAKRYRTIKLPAMDAARRQATEWAFAHAGFPYVWAGEWGSKTPGGYCCGAQPQGGFDCSGFVWWVLKDRSGGYSVPRSYPGWPLADRSSAYMGKNTSRRLFSTQLSPMDVVLFDSDGSGGDWATIDHAGLALGNGWMIHSSGSRAGVSISWIGDGFWKDRLYWGRRVIPGPDPVTPTPTPTPSPTASPSPSPSVAAPR